MTNKKTQTTGNLLDTAVVGPPLSLQARTPLRNKEFVILRLQEHYRKDCSKAGQNCSIVGKIKTPQWLQLVFPLEVEPNQWSPL